MSLQKYSSFSIHLYVWFWFYLEKIKFVFCLFSIFLYLQLRCFTFIASEDLRSFEIKNGKLVKFNFCNLKFYFKKKKKRRLIIRKKNKNPANPATSFSLEIDSEAHSHPSQRSKMELFAVKAVDYFCKNLHLICLTRFWIRVWIVKIFW